jgi:uncharacterized protein (TIGR02266 family)
VAGHVPPRIFRRVPFETAVRLRFDDFADFVTEYSGNISLGGMFVKIADPPPIGTSLEIEFRLDDGLDLIRGRGKVIWVRDEAPAPEQPAGIGVRFVELTPGSRELIFQVVDRFVRKGGTPFDLDEETAAAVRRAGAGGVSPVVPEPVPEPAAEPEASGAEPDRAAAPEATAAPSAAGTRGGQAGLPSFDDILLPPSAVAVPPDPQADRSPQVERAAVRAPHRKGGGAARRSHRGRWVVVTAAALALAVAGAGLFAFRDRVAALVAGPRARAEPSRDIVGAPPGFAHPQPSATLPEPAPAAPAAPAAASTPMPSPRGTVSAPPVATAGAAPDLSVPPAAAEPPAAEPAVAPALGPPATHVDKITWRQDGGATDLVIWMNGTVAADAFRHSHLGGPVPREVFRLRGIDAPFAQAELPVGTGQLRRVRTGYHPELSPPELHVVLDLAGLGVTMTSVEAEATRLHVRLEGR